MCDLFHRGDKKYWPEPLTDEEIEMYEAFRRPEDGPTPIDFWLDFSHRPTKRSMWNRHAAEVYVEQYHLSNYPDREHDGVKEEFWKHLWRLGQKSVEIGSVAKNQSSGAAKCQRRRRCVVTVRQFQDSSQCRPYTFLSFLTAASLLSSPMR